MDAAKTNTAALKEKPLPAKLAPADEPMEAGRLINLIPVGLKEAAIDSPTSRATIQHYTDQVDLLDRWLEDYLRATTRLVAEHVTLENIVNQFTAASVLPTALSETMLDHDYSVLAMRKYGESAKDYWMSMITVIKRLPSQVIEPIRMFQMNEMKVFRETRKSIDSWQKQYDSLHTKFMALGRYKEPSSLREDAFQLHETRRQYLRAVMDLFQTTPQFRFKLDKLLVKIFCDSWREMRQARENTATTFQKNGADIERVRGWIREMENSESSFQRELAAARKQLEDEAELTSRPSRELDEYSAFTMPHVGVSAHTHTTSNTSAALGRSPGKSPFKSGERSGWLFLRTYSGKPTRAIWVKRWAFVRNGVFGWLVHDPRIGGVEESERLGVLLCAVRPAPQEERRFCFELKTNRNTILLQAETQAELASWIAAFEAAKTKAVSDPSSSDSLATTSSNSDPAFSISAPPVPEFGTSILASTEPGAIDEIVNERSGTLPLPPTEQVRESSDILRRMTGTEDPQRDHASRIMSKLDIGRRTPTQPQLSPSPHSPHPSGGIASLIAASHGSMPVGPSLPLVPNSPFQDPPTPRSPFTLALRDMPASSLAPSTLANTPAPTGLSKAAVAVSGERGIRGHVTDRYGIPNGIMANTWGSSNTSYVNRFDRSELRVVSDSKPNIQLSPMLLPSPSPRKPMTPLRITGQELASNMDLALPLPHMRGRSLSPTKRHRNTISFEKNISRVAKNSGLPEFPNSYPLQLKTQDAQFRLLFPNVRRDERLTMVFRATWNPNGQQDFPGRAYVTTKEMYFYSNHFGLVLTSGISLKSVDEVTAAPGKDCDFLFVHFKEASTSGTTRITIKTFLEPLKLLQRRLNYLVTNSQADESQSLEEVIKQLLKLETEVAKRSPSIESWEDLDNETPAEGSRPRAATTMSEFRTPFRVDRSLYGAVDRSTTFKLPAQPVNYSPPGYNRVAVEREFDISPKALYHVMFGDRSALWQLLQHERRARDLKQGPWTPISRTESQSRLFRDFTFSIPTKNVFGKENWVTVKDYQSIDVANDHLCYVITDRRTPWHLPFQDQYRLVSKIVITHVAKTKCKLAIYIRVDWSSNPWIPGVNRVLEQQALDDLDLDAQDLADLVADQVRKLGQYSRTKKSIQIFGQVGHSSEITQLQIDASAINIEMRRIPQEKTMIRLLLQDVVSLAQTYLGTILQCIIDLLTWFNKILSANSVILTLLAASILYNTFFTLRDTYSWYDERNTAKFMRRLGVTPDHVMTRSITLTDLDLAMTSAGSLPNTSTNACYSVFHNDFLIGDLDGSISSTSSPSTKTTINVSSTARRLQQTRQKLGGYRHDLLVAMRVVNGIERDTVIGEYERWAVQEHRRCRAVGPFVNGTGGAGVLIGSDAGDAGGEQQRQLASWYDEYCASCGGEYERIVEGVGRL